MKQLPSDYKDTGICHFRLGQVALGKSDFEKSLKWYQKSFDIKLKTMKPNDPLFASDYGYMSFIYSKNSEHERVLEFLRKRFNRFKKALWR